MVPVEPKNAVGLVLMRRMDGGPLRILIGRRNPNVKFMPDTYVVPGGRIDRADHPSDPAEVPLRSNVAKRLGRHSSGTLPHAVARAAFRELHEETGLLAVDAAPDRSVGELPEGNAWSVYKTLNATPPYASVQYIVRAVTPEESSIRFNTRFLLLRNPIVIGCIKGDGELIDIHWRDYEELDRLRMPGVTRFVIERAAATFDDPSDAPAMRYIWKNGAVCVEED